MFSVYLAPKDEDRGAGGGHEVLTNRPEQLPGRTIQKNLEIQEYPPPGTTP